MALARSGSGRRWAEWRLSVVIGARRLRRGGRMPCSRMSLTTERFEMRKPRAFNSAWIRGAP